uniref:U13-Theraphotoxin-Sfo1a_1 n=1 Tax=Selenotholus foelschei TaxID=1905327 RepID=A0A482Z7V2_9ARAC
MGLKLAILISLLVLQGVFYVSCQECKSPDDCKPDECCAVGMMRYSVPLCLPMRKEGERCRVGNEPQDKQYYNSYGERRDATSVYRNLCPCSSGLECDKGRCSKI